MLPSLYDNGLLLLNFVVFLVLAQGLNLTYGFSGYLPFGYVGFFGAGAYGFSMLVTLASAGPVLAVVGGGVAALLVGLLLTPLLRLQGAYFGLASLAASEALLHLIANPSLQSVTGGPYGVKLALPYTPGFTYGIALGILVLTMAAGGLAAPLAVRIAAAGGAGQPAGGVDGGDGHRARAAGGVAGERGGRRADRRGVRLAGIDLLSGGDVRHQLQHLRHRVHPVRRRGSLAGPVLGVLLLYGLYNALGVSAPQYFQLAYGVLIMLLVLFLPEGLASIPRHFAPRGKQAQPSGRPAHV